MEENEQLVADRRPKQIEVPALTKRFGAIVAVDGLSFEVRPGVVTGFLGPNGAGKSTTMRVLLGLDHPTSGRPRSGPHLPRSGRAAAGGRSGDRRAGDASTAFRPRPPARSGA